MKRLPTGWIKAITSVLVLLAFVLMFAGPRVVKRPDTMSRKAFARRLAWYSGALGFCAIGALAGAYVVMRREQAAYRERALENMRELVEATRQDRLAKAARKEDEPAS